MPNPNDAPDQPLTPGQQAILDKIFANSKITRINRSGNLCSCVYVCGDASGWEDKACAQPHGLLRPLPSELHGQEQKP